MIISRTPYRLSFFGGGTDFPSWYRRHGGAVLSTTIDKYCYLTCRYLPPFFEHRIRVVWSKIENCKDVEELTHPAVREIIKFLNIERYLEIHHVGDLPARSGIGSSSSFTVGLINALCALSGRKISKEELSALSITVEQDILKENVGSQDQVCAAFGGFNKILFHENGEHKVLPLTIPEERISRLESRLLLFYTGIARTSSEIAKSYTEDLQARKVQLFALRDLVDRAVRVLEDGEDLDTFGLLMREGWEIKRSLSSSVSNPTVDNLLKRAYRAGAIGGKLTGAGGGGFLLLYVPDGFANEVRQELKELLAVPFRFESKGSQIIFSDSGNDYKAEEEISKIQIIEPFREFSELSSARK